MKVNAEARGKVESGFKMAEDGWHVVTFQEGIDLLRRNTEKGEEIVKDKKGNQSWKFPLLVTDPDDPSDGIAVDSIAGENERGEQWVANLLGAASLFESFAEHYPGERSFFEEEIMKKVKQKLPGQIIRIKTEQGPDWKDKTVTRVYIVGWGKMSDKIADLEAEFFPASDKKDKAAGTTTKGDGKAKAGTSKPKDDDF